MTDRRCRQPTADLLLMGVVLMKSQHSERRAPQRMASPDPPQSRLPALGRRGGGWVAIQVTLLAVAVAAGMLGTSWPPAAQLWLWIGGSVVLILSLIHISEPTRR